MNTREPLELRMYRTILRYFPREFQHDHADEMLIAFKDGLRDAITEKRLAAFWFETLLDLVSSLYREHRRTSLSKMKPTVNRFSDQSRLVFYYAGLEHQNLRKDEYVNTEHLLLGVLSQNKAIQRSLLEFDCTLETLRDRIRSAYPMSDMALDKTKHVSEEVRNMITIAAKLARTRGDGVIEPHHILLAILEQPSGLACKLLSDFASPDDIRARI